MILIITIDKKNIYDIILVNKNKKYDANGLLSLDNMNKQEDEINE